ncbi:unnamed protein product [Vicia faba]|uniref:Alanine--tRNA ligase n=1 Tax=Vicia faba TaxID=3906 RepID=A0AAV1AQZ6_VICFA|nr:unnamed protein product [Vicia faba]
MNMWPGISVPLPRLLRPKHAVPFPTSSSTCTGFISLKQLQLSPCRRFPFCTPSSHSQPQGEQLTVPAAENHNSVSGDSIRQRFLDFYASRGHKVLPSASLVLDDPTVLPTIAGMLQFKPIFLGKLPRQVPRATTAQRCIRTINNVGQTSRHHTFFEMLGNFSFGDYFKTQAIQWAWDLSTVEFALPPERLWISVYQHDDETFQLWSQQVGVPVERIKRLGEDDNFWTSGATGPSHRSQPQVPATGPCGPCSEICYDFHPKRGYDDADLNDDTRCIEFYNLVFMQYNKKDDGSLEPLRQMNIDTGPGLERVAHILQKILHSFELS